MQSYRQSLPFLLLLCGSMVAIADWLFYMHPVGWNLGLYSCVGLAALVWRSKSLFRQKAGRRIALAILGLVGAMFSQPGPIAFFLISLGLVTLALLYRNGWSASTSVWIRRWTIYGFKILYQLLHDLRVFQHWQKRGRTTSTLSWIKSGLLDWSLPVFFSLVFAGLFASANPVLSSWIEHFNRFLAQFHLDVGRIFFWIFTATLLWAFFRVRIRATRTDVVNFSAVRAPVTPSFLVRCLSLFNLVFAVQTILDVTYLYGGATLPDGLTYAAYAHRGAYPLIFTALLAGLFVLITFRENAGTVEMSTARKLVYVWLAQNVFLTVSSIVRLGLYIQAYNLSRWRIAAGLWMMLIAVGLILIGFRILQSKTNLWLLNSNFLATLALLYLCCFVNFDSIIAWYNVKHCREITGQGVAIDLDYLRWLGAESMPALNWLSGQPSVPANTGTRSAMYSQQLQVHLERELQDWRGWTYRKHALSQTYE